MTFSPIFGTLGLSGRQALTRKYFRLGRRTRVIRELIDKLLGASAGETAALVVKRVAHNLDENGLGGVREVEDFTMINRATVAGDVTDIKGYLSDPSNPAASYSDDAAGGGRVQRPAWPA